MKNIPLSSLHAQLKLSASRGLLARRQILEKLRIDYLEPSWLLRLVWNRNESVDDLTQLQNRHALARASEFNGGVISGARSILPSLPPARQAPLS
jgi:hypothetical protein